MKIDDLTVKRIENGYVVSWSERHPTPDGNGRYEYKEFYEGDVDKALGRMKDVLTRSDAALKFEEDHRPRELNLGAP